jgi:hypothetical protein
MLPEVVVLLELYLEACKSCRMFLSQQVGITAIPTTIVAQIVVTKPLATLMANHMLKVNHLNNSKPPYPCITVVHPLWEVMEVLDRNNRIKLGQALNPMLVHPCNQCKVWFLASH